MKRLFLALAIMGLFAQNTYAQRGSAKKEKTAVMKAEKSNKKSVEEKAKELTDALNAEVTLTKEQYSVIYKNNIEILTSKRAKRQAYKDTKKSITSVLTDEQRANFKEHPELTAVDKAEMRSSKMNQMLGLDRGQYSKVVSINKELFTSMEALKAKREKASGEREMLSLKGEGKSIRDNYKKQLSEVLTPEQLKKSKSLTKDAEATTEERAETYTKILNKKISLDAKQTSHIKAQYVKMFTEIDRLDDIRKTSREAILAQLTPEQAAKMRAKGKNRKK